MIPRLATAADVPALVRVINRAYRVEEFFLSGDRTNEDAVRHRMAKDGGYFLVIDAAPGTLAAAVYAELRGGARGYFGMLAVDPDHQHRGHGRALIAAVEERCRAAGGRFLDIDVVNLRRELPPFYASLGFAPYDTAPFPEPAKLHRAGEAWLVLMTKPLVSPWE